MLRSKADPIRPGAEGLVWTKDGTPVHGLTGGIWRDRRVEFVIPGDWKVGKEHVFYVETSMNGMFGKLGSDNPASTRAKQAFRMPP